jgi:Zinc knuckle
VGNKIPPVDQNLIGEGTPNNKPNMEEVEKNQNRDRMLSQTSAGSATAGGRGECSNELAQNVASGKNENNDGLNPFGRSKRVQRSPTRPESVTKSVVKPAEVKNAAGTQKLAKLKQDIEGLQEYVKDRHNVHQEIKRMIRLIKSSFNDLAVEVCELKSNADIADKQDNNNSYTTVATQTEKISEVQDINRTIYRGSQHTGSIPNQTRSAGDSEIIGKSGHSPELESNREEGEDWTKVTRKKRKKESSNSRIRYTRRARPDAIIVEKTEGTSYADILRKVKIDPSLKEMGERVARIRRTQKGQMIFELEKKGDQKGETYRGDIENALGGLAKVRVLTQEVNIVCKDMDEITSKTELLTALKEHFSLPGLQENAIKSMRGAYGGTQTAIISLPMEAARKVLSTGRLKIGWTICRLREYVRPKSCFRCLEPGHLAKDCKGIDRSKLCRKCGEEGHVARTCEKVPKCLLCEEHGDRPQRHVTGSSGCPIYRSAARSLRL